MDKSVLKIIPYGMYLVTSKDEKSVGCIINTFMQVTSDLVITINLNKENYTTKVIEKIKKFNVSILGVNFDRDIIKKFGYFSSKDIDKFEGLDVSYYNDMPVLSKGVVSNISCEVINFVDAGSHYVVMSKIIDMKKLCEDDVMTYSYYREVLKGSTPSKASTFVSEEGEDKYQCMICGYIYDNNKEQIKFEDLPDDYVCPLCGMGKSNFKKVG